MTTVLEPTPAPVPVAGRGRPQGPSADAPWEGMTRRHLQHLGVGTRWRCLVVGGGPSIAAWLRMVVGLTARPRFTDPGEGPLPEGHFDLVLGRMGDVDVLDRTAAVDRLLAAVRPGGWLAIEDDVSLPFALAANGRVAEAIRAAAAERATELDWARRLPARLRSRGCEAVVAEAHCSVWPGGATTIALPPVATPAPDADAGDGPAPVNGLPPELEPFTHLLVDPFRGGLVPPALAAGSYVLFTTYGRR